MIRIVSGQDGSSLIDVLIANLLMVVGVFSVLGPMAVGIRHLEDADRTSVAMNLARSTMEDTLRLGYGDLTSFEEGYGTIEGYPDFRRVVTVWDSTPVPDMRAVRIAVLWRVPGGNESTADGVPYDAEYPDAHRAFVELILLKEAF